MTVFTEKGLETARAIEEAALRLFERRGYAGTSIRDIAAEAGIDKSTIYHFFLSKHDLVAKIAERLNRRQAEREWQRLQRATGARERVYMFVRDVFRWVKESPYAFAFLYDFTLAPVRREDEYAWQEGLPTEGVLRQIIADGQASGEIRNAPVSILLMSFMIPVDIARRHVSGLLNSDLENIWEHVAELVWHGLRGDASDGSARNG